MHRHLPRLLAVLSLASLIAACAADSPTAVSGALLDKGSGDAAPAVSKGKPEGNWTGTFRSTEGIVSLAELPLQRNSGVLEGSFVLRDPVSLAETARAVVRGREENGNVSLGLSEVTGTFILGARLMGKISSDGVRLSATLRNPDGATVGTLEVAR